MKHIELEPDDNKVGENGILWRTVPWDIRRESRAWDKPEIEIKYFRCLQEIKEMTEGKPLLVRCNSHGHVWSSAREFEN